MRAIFIVPVSENNLVLPDLLDFSGGSARPGSGYSAIGQIPQSGSALVLVDSSDAIIDAMADDPQYLYVEDVP